MTGYRIDARNKHLDMLKKRIKVAIFMTVEPLDDGGFFFNDHSFFMNYVHQKNALWQTFQDIERNNFIRDSHHILYKNHMYYVQGIDDFELATETIRTYHEAKYVANLISVYRLD